MAMYRAVTVHLMSNLLFGFALISASLQTGWAIFAEGQLFALSAVVVMLYAGWRNVRAGSEHLQSKGHINGLL